MRAPPLAVLGALTWCAWCAAAPAIGQSSQLSQASQSNQTASSQPQPPAAPKAAAKAAAEAPAEVPAVSPLRLLPINTPKKGGLTPDLKLGSGAMLRPYGFFKTSVVQQTASHGGATFGSNDFPQGPLLLGDTGPDGDPQFHIKVRSFRAGIDFEWPDASQTLVLTGKLEVDFEGDFTDVNNRNISANRSSQPSLRLAWVRLSRPVSGLPWFVEFGQNWSVFGSSTLMDLLETTGFGFAQGNLYERMPMVRTGIQFHRGPVKFQPEVAIALAGFGEAALTADQRERFGGRVGPESNRPELEVRGVVDLPLFHAAGVDTTQVIVSYDRATRAEIIDSAGLPAGPIHDAFPNGVRLTSTRNAWTIEAQVPTPVVTVVGKFYDGDDLRYYFMGQFNDIFVDLGGATSIGTATSFSGRVVPFGSLNGVVVAPTLEPIDGRGGFVQVGIPLSRLMHAKPNTRAAGWTAYGTYGIDTADDREAARGNGLRRTDHVSGQIRYRLNRWVTFAFEETYLRTLTATGVTKLFKGQPVDRAHAWRSELGTIFTF